VKILTCANNGHSAGREEKSKWIVTVTYKMPIGELTTNLPYSNLTRTQLNVLLETGHAANLLEIPNHRIISIEVEEVLE